MTRKLKSSARKSRRNTKLFVVGFIVILAVAIGAVFVFAQSNLKGENNGNTQPSSNNNTNGAKLEGPLKVLLQTSMGNITIQLRDDKPITAGNFRDLVEQGLYDGTIFHRVTSFLIQGGSITQTVPPINDELGGNNTNVRATVAMAKSFPNTATSGFFINVEDNCNQSAEVDKTYTVFGYVTEGMEVVDAISKVAADADEKPLQGVTIIKALVLP